MNFQRLKYWPKDFLVLLLCSAVVVPLFLLAVGVRVWAFLKRED